MGNSLGSGGLTGAEDNLRRTDSEGSRALQKRPEPGKGVRTGGREIQGPDLTGRKEVVDHVQLLVLKASHASENVYLFKKY